MNPWKKIVILSVIVLLMASTSPEVRAFCGFYVAKADAKLFNKSSQVVLARIDDKTVLTMANDYEGDLKEFAIVVPVPTVLEKDQIHVGEKSVIERIDTFTSPRLVEYFDENPCAIQYDYERKSDSVKSAESPSGNVRKKNGHGVTIEAQYTVGEYDILILSAKESGGLESWLTDNGYKIPKGASAVLAVYIKQNMKFFVAKVNLKEQSKTGFSYLRPIQMAFESPKFMLPIRLGMVNANGSQDLFIYALTTKGRVETTNYRTVKIPSNVEIPVYVKENFSEFYKGMFSSQLKKEDLRVVFLEHAWDMSWCDPCATEPLSNEEMKKLGVFWLGGSGNNEKMMRRQPLAAPQGGVFVTRLHVRYDFAHFPEDLVFQETGDRTNFQGRYVLRHPYNGDEKCDAMAAYKKGVRDRQEREAQTLSNLTGWDIQKIRDKMNLGKQGSGDSSKWWKKIWD